MSDLFVKANAVLDQMAEDGMDITDIANFYILCITRNIEIHQNSEYQNYL